MNDIMRYIIKRLLIGILVVLFVTVLIFGIMQAMPGNPVDLMVDTRVSAEKVEAIKAEWGLDKPPVVQYFYWLGNILRGNFGMSISLKQNVSDLILQRLPYTLLLTGAALVIEYLLAIPLGLLAAVRKNKITDKALTITTVVLWSMPPFWLGVLLMLVFSIHLNILPLSGYSGFASLILPALTLSLPALAQIFRLTRSEVLDVMDEKYVTTAYAKGITDKKILVRHVLRNSGNGYVFPVTALAYWRRGGCGKCFRVAGHGAAALERHRETGLCHRTGHCVRYYHFDGHLQYHRRYDIWHFRSAHSSGIGGSI